MVSEGTYVFALPDHVESLFCDIHVCHDILPFVLFANQEFVFGGEGNSAALANQTRPGSPHDTLEHEASGPILPLSRPARRRNQALPDRPRDRRGLRGSAGDDSVGYSSRPLTQATRN